MGKNDKFGLTKREEEIIRAFREVGHAKGVAAKLGISPSTVEEHLAAIRMKTDSDNTLLAVFKYFQDEDEDKPSVRT